MVTVGKICEIYSTTSVTLILLPLTFTLPGVNPDRTQ